MHQSTRYIFDYGEVSAALNRYGLGKVRLRICITAG